MAALLLAGDCAIYEWPYPIVHSVAEPRSSSISSDIAEKQKQLGTGPVIYVANSC